MSLQRATSKLSQSQIENSAPKGSFSINEQKTYLILKTK